MQNNPQNPSLANKQPTKGKTDQNEQEPTRAADNCGTSACGTGSTSKKGAV